ncbi:hypothetical protein BH09VER1_BH09VER1_42630 [soil metagenome]
MCRFVAITLSLLALATAGAGEYGITVKAGAEQTFGGFGASQVGEEFGHYAPEPYRSQMADLVYRDLKARVLRLWVQAGPEHSLAEMKAAFYAQYVDNGVISLITQRGVSTLLLAPARGMDAPKDSLPAYAAKIAQFIADLKTERGMSIAVTGIANEPEGWSGEQLAETIKLLRAELDRRGLEKVGIIAPEDPSANEAYDAHVAALRADPAAWAALAGVASHSYNMALRDEGEAGKPLWITEAADDGSESGEDEARAASLAGRFLNDLNHGACWWIYFKGFSYSPDVAKDDYSASRLTQYDAARGGIVTHLKYYYLKQLLAAFEVGTVLRRCESAAEGRMVYTYGLKPKACAAAGVDPDGSWALGVVNLTGLPGRNEIARWQPAETLEVTVKIDELATAPDRVFRLTRSRAGQHAVEGGEVTMKGGSVSLRIAPMELITLRSAAKRVGK